jgi:hypothetical protein
MNISYQYLDKPLTEQQAMLSKNYYKIYTQPNGLVKMKESIANDELIRLDYYREPDESEEEAKQFLETYNCGFDILIRENYHGFTIEIGNAYNPERILIRRFKNVVNDEGELICSQELDVNTLTPIFEETIKSIGTYQGDEDEDPSYGYYCLFHYNEDGSLNYCEFNYLSDYDRETFNQNDIALIREKFILSDEMYNWYLTAEFLPPY